MRAGERLFRAGEPGDRLYAVQSGRPDVVGEDDEGVLRRIGRGEVVPRRLDELAPRGASGRPG